ncbi:MAG TPA: tetratricopeptide repeat protein [Gemmataceae bacterium]|nr:tetratricopeptide repeat protein [Gemmataceae bacterium]
MMPLFLKLAAPILRPRWLALFLVLCGGAAVGGYFWWTWRATENLVPQAQAAAADRDFDRAKALLQAYLAARPGDGKAHFLLAQVCRRARAEDFEQAYQELYQARHFGYSGADVELESALLTIQEKGPSGLPPKALQECLDSHGPEEALALEALARGCIDHNRLDEANGWLNRWIAAAPDDWYGRLWRGALFEFTNNPGPAAGDFEFVCAKRPSDEAIRLRLGVMLSFTGSDCSKALRYLEPYHRDHPESAEAAVAVARCRRLQVQLEQAAALLKPVLNAHPDDIDALLLMAQVAADGGDDRSALDYLHRLKPLIQRSHSAAFLGRLRRLEPVVNHLDAPDRMHHVYLLTATILGRMGRTEEAKQYLADVDQIDGLQKDIAKAVDACNRNPRDLAALENAGMLYLKVGMPDDAIDALERVVKENPKDVAAHQALAEAQRQFAEPARPSPNPREP